jgi:cobalt-zinc-cadmium efflux system outer membrane protein
LSNSKQSSTIKVASQFSQHSLAILSALIFVSGIAFEADCAYAAGNPTSLQGQQEQNIFGPPQPVPNVTPPSLQPSPGAVTLPGILHQAPGENVPIVVPGSSVMPGSGLPGIMNNIGGGALGEPLPPTGPGSPQTPDLRPSIPPSKAPISLSASISVQQALDQTLMYGPRAAAFRSLVGISKAAITQAKVYPNPALEFDNGYAEFSYRVGVALPIEPPWKMLLRIAAAKALVGTANIQMEQSLWLLRADIRRAYTELVVAQESQKMMQELALLTGRLAEVAKKRFQNGDVAKLDVYKAELAASQAETDAGQAERRVIQAREQLNIIMGRNENTELAVPSLSAFQLRAEHNQGLLPDLSRPMPPEAQFIDEALRNRLELKLVKQEIKATEANRRLTKGNVFPTGQLAFGYDRQVNFPPEATLNRMYLMGSFPLPITDFQQGEFARLKATMHNLNLELLAQENIVRGQVALAYRKVFNARENMRRYQDSVLAQSQKVSELGRQSYQLGQTDITSALNAQQASIQVRNLYLTEVMNYELAFTDLEQSVGHILQ